MRDTNWGLRDYYAADEDPNVRYLVILVEGERLPHAVVRLTGTTEDAFTHNLMWEPSNLLSRVPDEPQWTAREAAVGYANGFLVQMVREISAATHESELSDHKYYAVFKHTEDVVDLSKAYLLIRRPQPYREEKYAGHNRWEETDKLYRLDSGRDWTEEYIAISEAGAQFLRQRIDANWAALWRHHVVFFADGTPYSVVVAAKDPQRQTGTQEFTGDGKFRPTEVLDKVSASSIQEIDFDSAVRIMADLVRQRSAEREAPGAYAVFHHPTDVLDPESAYAIVREPGPEHEIVLPLSSMESERLAARLHVRNAKRRAAAVGGHQHFAVFESARATTDVNNAYSAIRRTTDEPGRWEMFLRPGEWLPTASPQNEHTLAISQADLDRITGRLATAEPRYFELRCRERGPVALVRLTATAEESALDLGWEPSDVFARLPREPTWYVTEVDERGMVGRRFWSATLRRGVAHRNDEIQYFAIFPTQSAAFDLAEAQLVMRQRGAVEEMFVRPDGWVTADRPLTEFTVRHLPISPDEAERLTG
ncbi:hypothetical protein [Amycolatopsis decaplanina]|uniref:Uncharacterized protein n=1 Tax=Amycolatopsis decaplanina DSM 44594 TaxID=1284240 RepID=M2YTJ2_9PSEU|nr:hypothetical protein [Amycolatopsis decaplanina]EME52058.1 hypothetical protein H074_34903 [Amycolatopsis decaplanina DSM 44594]